ncbi:hypothetical protein K505DRAFT_334823 [Melanomma pulvis-pyrius CBS 109.77]|uniref:Uncharacterized protein n=1 Tax=Melanomma pulvis-pyrius CBS 109.77 TaxID=1314802 RepID=A0A6A6XJU9_9PLEO|nr:hypothetical protein K505DRAFT_334823 [Melanomma pulvis-pyrius CBS 109.77]
MTSRSVPVQNVLPSRQLPRTPTSSSRPSNLLTSPKTWSTKTPAPPMTPSRFAPHITRRSTARSLPRPTATTQRLAPAHGITNGAHSISLGSLRGSALPSSPRFSQLPRGTPKSNSSQPRPGARKRSLSIASVLSTPPTNSDARTQQRVSASPVTPLSPSNLDASPSRKSQKYPSHAPPESQTETDRSGFKPLSLRSRIPVLARDQGNPRRSIAASAPSRTSVPSSSLPRPRLSTPALRTAGRTAGSRLRAPGAPTLRIDSSRDDGNEVAPQFPEEGDEHSLNMIVYTAPLANDGTSQMDPEEEALWQAVMDSREDKPVVYSLG